MNTSLAAAMSSLLGCFAGIAMWPQEPVAAAARGVDAAAVSAAATKFLGSLSPELRSKAQRPLDDAERTAWNFVPGRYAGVELGMLDGTQRGLVRDVVAAMLSARGLAKTDAIAARETILHDLEAAPGKDVSHRDPDRYSLLVCGEPAANGTYTVRYQGHHVSLQLAVEGGRVVAHTPQFLGSNPHELTTGAGRGQRVLGAEEDLARGLLRLFDDVQLARVTIAKDAPADVLLGPGKEPSALGARAGLPWSAMNDVQRGVLWRLIEVYADVWYGDLAADELRRIREGGLDGLTFAWAGGLERGQGHYYRIHGAHFAIEYDNTQNDANHVHTVWRDFVRDFGGDALRQHLHEQHEHR